MRLLVDTHLVLWAAAKSRSLPKEARSLLEDPANELFFSAASLWEIAIKAALRRSDFRVDLALLRPALAAMDFAELPVSGAHAERLASLPPIPQRSVRSDARGAKSLRTARAPHQRRGARRLRRRHKGRITAAPAVWIAPREAQKPRR